MPNIEIFYIIAALAAISACLPQLRQLIITKASDELSLPTWVMWLGAQCVTLLYVISIGNILMTIVNVAWVSFYAAMVWLIIYYRRNNLPQTTPVTPVLAPEEAS